MLDALKEAYDTFAQLNISVTSLIVIAVILGLAFLFSVREAATWFFKVDDLKRDIARLSETARQMDAQIKTLQTLMTEVRTSTPEAHVASPAPSLPLSTTALAKTTSRFSGTLRTEKEPVLQEETGSFPIVH